MSERSAMKDMYNRTYLKELATVLKESYPPFDESSFLHTVFDHQWEDRSLKERMRHISIIVGDFLPEEFREALKLLRQSSRSLRHYGFENMIFPEYVGLFGLDDWETSIPALEEFTQLISSEYAVRLFIIQNQPRMMAQMRHWSEHENHHIRRLASEGCRPRLPWGVGLPALKKEPAPILPILEQLKHDPSEYVRRSVANNLNDISKDHPDTVLNRMRIWKKVGTKEMDWLVRHASRSMLKAGNVRAYELLGYSSDPAVEIRDLKVDQRSINLGEQVHFTFDIVSLGPEPQPLMIDYVVHLVRARGKRSAKVFKLTKRIIQSGQTMQMTRAHSFRPITTRRYYPGQHAIQLMVNGKLFQKVYFDLLD